MNDVYDFFDNKESEQTRRIKNERINRGQNYRDYFTASKWKKMKGNKIGRPL